MSEGTKDTVKGFNSAIFGIVFIFCLTAAIIVIFTAIKERSLGFSVQLNLSGFEVQVNLATFFRACFSGAFSFVIFRWVNARVARNDLEGIFELLAHVSILLSYCILLILVILPSMLPDYQNLLLCYLWIFVLALMAAFRGHMAAKRDLFKDTIRPILVCLLFFSITVVCSICMLTSMKIVDWIVAASLIFLIIPRVIMCEGRRVSGKEHELYTWFQVYTILIFISVAAHIGYRWFMETIKEKSDRWILISGGANRTLNDGYFASDFVLFLIILIVSGIFGYLCIFPSEKLTTNLKNDMEMEGKT